VDIGVHQDGLVHVSQLSDHYVKEPSTLVKAGDVVTVRVLEVDVKRKRIALSMRKQEGPQQRQVTAPTDTAAARNNRRPQPREKSAPQGALGAALSEAFRRK